MSNEELSRHGRSITSVFDLLGTSENDLTAALGFTFARCPALLKRIAAIALPKAYLPSSIFIAMEVRDDAGRTDLEIRADGLLAVVEAKKGWHLPTVRQLHQYTPRIRAAGGGNLVTLSDCSTAWADINLVSAVDNVPVRHLPWSEVRTQVDLSRSESNLTSRFLLAELENYLKGALLVRDPRDSYCYCVSVRTANDDPGWKIIQTGHYVHPYGWGQGWPQTPPNFLALRWGNHVQQVHRVESWEVIATVQDRFPQYPQTEASAKPHIKYQLGPQILPQPLPSGANYRAARVWALLDQLLTQPTLKDAIINSRRLTDSATS